MIGIIAMIVALTGWIMFILDKKNRVCWLGVALCGNLVQVLYFFSLL
jgi:hypothetical protein